MKSVLSKAPAGSEAESFTVQQVALLTGLSEHTLRFYERSGLIAPISRQGRGGHRRYALGDVARLRTLACLRAVGMPMDAMRAYLDLVAQGQSAAPQAKAMFVAQRSTLEARIAQMQEHLSFLDLKLAYWTAVDAGDEAATQRLEQAMGDTLGAAALRGDEAQSPTRQVWP